MASPEIRHPPRHERSAAAANRRFGRRGAAAVEAAVVLPVILVLMLGVWEVGRLVQVTMTLTAAAREGARIAAGGTNSGSGTPVTASAVQQAVRDYLEAAGLPLTAVNGADVQVTNRSANNWTDPGYALPGDAFSVSITIPPGTAFNSLHWLTGRRLTSVDRLKTEVFWRSANDSQVTVSATLPY